MLYSLPYMIEAIILLSALSVAIGWRQIRRKQVKSHKRFMIIGTVLAALFFIGYAVKTIFVGDTTFGGPPPLRLPYQIFLQLHSILAVVAAVLGVMTLRFAYKRTYEKHRPLGRLTATIWLITVASGLAVFMLLYIIYPPGPTTNLLRAWIGY